MPKMLKEPPPTSSIARLLDFNAAARAVALPPSAPISVAREPVTPENQSAPQVRADNAVPTGERPRLNRQLVLTPSADETLSRLVDLYRRATDSKLTSSHVTRAVLRGIAHCMDHLEREARRIGPLKLPSNARGRELERERFEARIADAFVAGIRAAPAFEQDGL